MLLGLVYATAIPASASTIPITYDLTGMLTADPVQVGDTLQIQDERTGSIATTPPALGATWNPVTILESCDLDLTTGILTGTFNATFSNGAMLKGTILQDDSQVTDTGPFTETLTFTGGTGEFAGATGSASGAGFIGDTGYTVAGSGVLDAPSVPEPKSALLFIGGLALLIVRRRCSGTRTLWIRRTL